MKPCLICNSLIDAFLSFGQMPQANAYLLPEQFNHEAFFDLAVGFCENCLMVQLIDPIEPVQQFHENYAFISSTSVHMQHHFQQFAQECIKKYLSKHENPFIVEIGCNDGIFLKHFAATGIRHLGVEPSKNVASIAAAQGLNVISEFFNEKSALTIIQEEGHADLICAANVIGHIADIHSVAKGIRQLLSEKGIFVFEHPYLFDNLAKTAYDQIYDEHIYYFSAHSVEKLFSLYGLELINLEKQSVHGGSMRYTLAIKNQHVISDNVARLLAIERSLGIDQPETYYKFAAQTASSRLQLLDALHDLKKQNKRVIGYGATAKSSTVINYCGITTDLLECICDISPTKQNKFSPGMHIPIFNFDHFYNHPPDVVLLFAWNHAHEIMQKEQTFSRQGGKWLIYIPEIKIIYSIEDCAATFSADPVGNIYSTEDCH